MFVRSTQGAFICRRCRSKLECRLQVVLGSANNNPFDRRPRWQSTATASVEDDGDLEFPRDDHSTVPVEAATKRDRTHIYRNWRPSVQLGVQALGKPAEVLVLPSRDRKIPIAPSDGKDLPQKLQESLDAELQPVSPEQVSENIEHLRVQFGRTPPHLSDEEWRKMRHSLSAGFTKNQLATYIAQKQPKNAKKLRISPSRGNWKQQMAKHIIKNIWSYTTQDASDETSKPDCQASVNIKRHYLDAMLQLRSQLQNLCEKHNVQLDIYSEHGRIVVIGNDDNVAAGRAAVVSLRDSLTKGTLHLKYDVMLPRAWTDDDVQKFVRTLEQRYGVHIARRPKGFNKREEPSLDIFHHKDDKDIVTALRREILLTAPLLGTSTKHVPWPRFLPDSVSLGPVFPNLEMHPSHSKTKWGRHLFKDDLEVPTLANSFTDKDDSSGSEIYKRIRDHMREELPSALLESPRIREEFTAHFGQALFDRTSPDLVLKSIRKDKAQPSKSLFSSSIPLLSQLISSLDTWGSPASSKTSDAFEAKSSPTFIFRVVLAPARSAFHLPKVEIVLVGQDHKLGLNQDLKVHTVQAVLKDHACDLLLPALAVDVRFISQLKVDLYDTNRKPSSSHQDLLTQLRTFLKHASGRDHPRFPPFVDLNIGSAPELSQWMSFSKSRPDASSHISSETPAQSSNSIQDLNAVEYVLSRAESVDSAAYRAPSSSKLCLNQATAHDDTCRNDSRTFSLTHGPLFGQQQEKPKFSTFFNTAYEVALRLGKRV